MFFWRLHLWVIPSRHIGHSSVAVSSATGVRDPCRDTEPPPTGGRPRTRSAELNNFPKNEAPKTGIVQFSTPRCLLPQTAVPHPLPESGGPSTELSPRYSAISLTSTRPMGCNILSYRHVALAIANVPCALWPRIWPQCRHEPGGIYHSRMVM